MKRNKGFIDVALTLAWLMFSGTLGYAAVKSDSGKFYRADATDVTAVVIAQKQ